MEKRKLTPREMVAREVMSDETRTRTMSDEEASEAIHGLLIHLQERAYAAVDAGEGLDEARQYEICARIVAYFGTALIAAEDMGIEIGPPTETGAN